MSNWRVVQKDLIEDYVAHLAPLATKLGFKYSISPDEELIEIRGGTLTTPEFKMFTINIHEPTDTVGELVITELFVPSELYSNKIVFGLIEISYQVAIKHDYDTFITHMTSSFYRLMTETRHAKPVNYETVEILSTTNLK